MMKWILAYGGTAVTLAAMDAVWLSVMASRLYRPAVGSLMMENGFRLGPAIAFYVLYVLGIVIFAVAPALTSGKAWQALLMGALFGFFCYLTYGMTNMATLKVWPLNMTLIDLAWGAVLTGTAAFAGWQAAARFG